MSEPFIITPVEKLTLNQQYNLIKIAHETYDLDIKEAALELLQTSKMYLNAGKYLRK